MIKLYKRFLYLCLILFSCGALEKEPENKLLINGEYFGMHMHRVLKQQNPWPDLPFRTWRLWDCGTSWANLQPEKERWDFEKLDLAVEYSEKYDVELILTLGQSPIWASKRKTDWSPYGDDISPAEPADIEDWKTYIRTLAVRYKGKIRYWEIWNEPDIFIFYTGSVKTLVRLTKEAYIILKEVDSENQVIMPPVSHLPAALPFMRSFFREGGGDYVDIIGFHYYTSPLFPPESLYNHILKIQNIMETCGVQDKRLWNTEGGAGFIDLTEAQKNSYLARMFLIQAPLGVERFCWYAWDNTRLKIQLYDQDKRKITRAAGHYREIANWLTGWEVAGLYRIDGFVWYVHIKREGRSRWIVWRSSGNAKFSIPTDWQIIGGRTLDGKNVPIEGGKTIFLTQQPVLLSQ